MTLVPVPKVIAFDDSRDNEIGFEWILMELMPGVSAFARWRKMSMADKTRVVEQIADFQGQLFRRSIEDAKFQSIGNRLTDIAAEPVVFDPKPGQLVSRFFFRGNHFRYDIPRGPFPSSHDWLSTYLGIIRQEQTDILQNDDDEDVREDAESCLQVATKLAALLPKIFPPLQHPAERTVLWHDDLSLSNILVDADNADDAKVTTILDWECVSCQPLWAATEMPKFLLGPTREAEPVRDGYADDDGEDDVHVGADGLDNEGRTELYWIHRMEYDMTRLRKVYNEQVWEQLVPWWETEVLYGALKLDFLAAVEQCAAGWHLKGVVRWVEAVEGGKHPRLMDVLDPNWNG